MSEQDEHPAVIFHRVTPESIAEFLAWQAEGCTIEEFTFSSDPGELFEGSDSTVTLKGFWSEPT